MKKFLNAPLSNVVSLIACVALVLATLYGGLMHGELAPLTLGGVTAGASTPKWIIDEVMDKIEELNKSN